MISFTFNKDKAVAAILYISTELQKIGAETGLHSIFKILYFAEKKHLAKYARPITGDIYVAMEYGPVPSASYNMLQGVRDDIPFFYNDIKEKFQVKGWNVIPLCNPELDEMSDSDIDFLNDSIKENQNLSFGERTDKSHGSAWSKTPQNKAIDFCDIADEEGASSDMCDLIKLTAENEQFAASL